MEGGAQLLALVVLVGLPIAVIVGAVFTLLSARRSGTNTPVAPPLEPYDAPSHPDDPDATAPLPRPAAPAPAAGSAAPPGAPALDPELATALSEATALLESASPAIAAVPDALIERAAFHAERLASESQLAEIRRRVETLASPQSQLTATTRRIAGQLKSLLQRADRLSEDVAQLNALKARLAHEIPAVQAALDALGGQAILPVAWGAQAVLSTALDAARSFAEHAPPTSSDQLQRELLQVSSLLGDIARTNEAIDRARAQWAALRALLSQPELAVDPRWYRALHAFVKRISDGGRQPAPAVSALTREADELVRRRQRLFAGCPPTASGSFRVDAGRLPEILDEALAIQRDVRALWERARSIQNMDSAVQSGDAAVHSEVEQPPQSRVLFIHGTMGRYDAAYLAGFNTIRARLVSWHPGIEVEKIPWGEYLGANVAHSFAAIPGAEPSTQPAVLGAAPASAPSQPITALWDLLYSNPLGELRALAAHSAIEASADQTLSSAVLAEALEELVRRPLPDRIASLAAAGGVAATLPTACAQIVALFNGADLELHSALYGFDDAEAPSYRVALARACVARAMVAALTASSYPALYTSGRRRDALVEAIEQYLRERTTSAMLGGGIGDAALWLVAQPLTRLFLRPNRAALTADIAHFAGDILAYQARGAAIRKLIAETVLNGPPAVLLGHSLGGIACFELLLEQSELRRKVPLLITVGSQAPLLYELDALALLRYRSDGTTAILPADFPPWLNIYDCNDLLSFQTGGLFDGTLRDVEIDSLQPFPHAHNAYWDNDRVWDHIYTAIGNPGNIPIQLR